MRVQLESTLQPAQAFFALAAAKENFAESAVQGRVARPLQDFPGDNVIETR
jgi:hypothetical protein